MDGQWVFDDGGLWCVVVLVVCFWLLVHFSGGFDYVLVLFFWIKLVG